MSLSDEERKIVLRALGGIAMERVRIVNEIAELTTKAIKLRRVEEEIEHTYLSLSTLVKTEPPIEIKVL
jgi:hypothetical protein